MNQKSPPVTQQQNTAFEPPIRQRTRNRDLVSKDSRMYEESQVMNGQEQRQTGPFSFLEQIPASVRRPVYAAVGLVILGVAMLVSGLVLWRTEGTSALIGLWVCGILVLIPGVYVSRVAYYAYKGVEGYMWTDIPDVFR